MGSNNIEDKVAAHYSRSDLTKRVLEKLGAEQAQPGDLTIEALAPIDQLHHGGMGLSERLARVAGITTGMHVLDAGSGIGGGARYLADRLGCTIEALDLSPDFIATAKDLDRLVGVADKINQHVGSVTDLPFEADQFDVVWSQNVTMNIADKHTMFSEAHRVLRPGGVFAFTHIAATDGADLDYPMPWAMTPETSFLGTQEEVLDVLRAVGFDAVEDHAKPAPTAPPPGAEPPQDNIAMGDDMPLRRENTMKAVMAGHLTPMMVTARRMA